jgi:hypothetical protein
MYCLWSSIVCHIWNSSPNCVLDEVSGCILSKYVITFHHHHAYSSLAHEVLLIRLLLCASILTFVIHCATKFEAFQRQPIFFLCWWDPELWSLVQNCEVLSSTISAFLLNVSASPSAKESCIVFLCRIKLFISNDSLPSRHVTHCGLSLPSALITIELKPVRYQFLLILPFPCVFQWSRHNRFTVMLYVG